MLNLPPPSFDRRTKYDKYPLIRYLIKSTAVHWKAYVEHEFVKQLGRAVLPRSAFIHYIMYGIFGLLRLTRFKLTLSKDRIIIIWSIMHAQMGKCLTPQDIKTDPPWARDFRLLAAKSSTFSEIGSATQTLLDILREIDTHRSFCHSFGITQGQLESTPETSATIAYGAFLIDIGLQGKSRFPRTHGLMSNGGILDMISTGDSTKLLLALLVCLVGYGEIGFWLKREAANEGPWVITKNNPYEKWINNYSGERYQHAVKLGLGELFWKSKRWDMYIYWLITAAIEARVTADAPSPTRLKEWREVWDKCTLLEKGFWDSAMEHA